MSNIVYITNSKQFIIGKCKDGVFSIKLNGISVHKHLKLYIKMRDYLESNPVTMDSAWLKRVFNKYLHE